MCIKQSDSVMPRHFLSWAYKITAPIEESFKMAYKDGNPIKEVVEKNWIDISAQDALSVNTDALVKKLFPPDSYEQYRIAKDREE